MLAGAAMLVLAVLVLGLLREINASITYQRAVRVAAVARARILRLQIDEETGIRGYRITRDTSFLKPYYAALRLYPSVQHDFEQALAALGPNAGSLGADSAEEQRYHERWLSEYAGPALQARGAFLSSGFESHGRDLIDAYRAANQRLSDALDTISDVADARFSHSTLALVLTAAVFEAVILGLAFLSAAAEDRAERIRVATRAIEERYEEERRITETMQSAFLQNELPTLPNLGLHASYTPAERQGQVGGDWYDAVRIHDACLFFSIGDVTGHGLEAAVEMSRVRQSLISAAIRERDPGAILASANDTLLLQGERVVTAICGFIDLDTFEIRYATAGHPPPALAHPDRRAHYLPYDGLPLGIERPSEYRTFVANGAPGALLVLYTDGLIEHKRDVILGQAKVLRAVADAAHARHADPTQLIRERVFEAVNPADDVAILAIRFNDRRSDGPPDVTINARQQLRTTISKRETGGPQV